MSTSTQHGLASGAATAFVIGPGRSGTTLLYKLLCLHPAVAYLSTIEHRLPWLPAALAGRVRVRGFAGKLKYWFQAGGNAYLVRRPLLQKLVPAPVEGEAVYRRHGLLAIPDLDAQVRMDGSALRGEFERLRAVAGKALFVSKRTANNRRLPMIDALFPGARYLNLKRDGRDVAASLSRVEWWNDHTLWWDPQHRTPLQVSATGEDMLRLCARNWVAETQAIEQGLSHIDPERVLDVQFERLVVAPVTEMQRVLDFLGLECSAGYDRAITSLGLGMRPGSWQREWSADQIDMVSAELSPYLARQGYAA
jgi:hypothetical protein